MCSMAKTKKVARSTIKNVWFILNVYWRTIFLDEYLVIINTCYVKARLNYSLRFFSLYTIRLAALPLFHSLKKFRASFHSYQDHMYIYFRIHDENEGKNN